jgi:hypothetical protein
MRIPAFIKQLAKCCDSDAVRYALGGVQCLSDGKTAQLTATDGRILANVYYPDEDEKPVSAIVDGKAISSPPAAAFKKSVEFDGSTLRHGGTESKATLVEGRFPRIEDVFNAVHDNGTDGYACVKLDGALLRKLADLAATMSEGSETKGITLFVKDQQSCVFATCRSNEGHVARMAIMPRAADDGKRYTFPPRPGEAPAEQAEAKPKKKREMIVQNTTVYPDGRRVPGETVNVTTGKVIAPAPVPEMMDDEQVAVAIAEPDAIGIVGGNLAPVT